MLVKYARFFIREYLFTLLSAVFVVLYWNSAKGLPKAAIQYPVVISIIAVFFIGWNVYISIGEFRKIARLDTGDKRFDITYGLSKGKVVVICSTILYVVCIHYVGYVVSTFVYLSTMAYFLGSRKPLRILIYAAGLTAFFYVVFRMGLAVRLPAGMLI